MAFNNTIKIWFEIESRCNLDCKFCYDHIKDSLLLKHCNYDTNKILMVLDKLFSNTKVESIALSGGEPLLRHDLEEILKHIQKYRVPTILTTNGTLLTEQKIIRYMKLGVITFQISLHSAEREVHNHITGRPSWEDTITSIIRTTQNGGYVVLVFVATRLNLTHFKDVLKIAAICGIGKVFFNRFLPGEQRNKINKQGLSITDKSLLKRVLHESNDFARSNNIKISLGTPIKLTDKEQKKLDCIEPTSCPIDTNQQRFILDAKGNIRQCIQNQAVLGNLLKEDISTILQRKSSFVTCS